MTAMEVVVLSSPFIHTHCQELLHQGASCGRAVAVEDMVAAVDN